MIFYIRYFHHGTGETRDDIIEFHTYPISCVSNIDKLLIYRFLFSQQEKRKRKKHREKEREEKREKETEIERKKTKNLLVESNKDKCWIKPKMFCQCTSM